MLFTTSLLPRGAPVSPLLSTDDTVRPPPLPRPSEKDRHQPGGFGPDSTAAADTCAGRHLSCGGPRRSAFTGGDEESPPPAAAVVGPPLERVVEEPPPPLCTSGGNTSCMSCFLRCSAAVESNDRRPLERPSTRDGGGCAVLLPPLECTDGPFDRHLSSSADE